MVLKGKDIMLFIAGYAIAMAKSCDIEITADELDTSNKDTGIWKDSEIGALGWSATSEGFTSLENQAASVATEGNYYNTLFNAMTLHQPIQVVMGMPTNLSNGDQGKPEAGWTAPTSSSSSVVSYTGSAVITSLKLTGAKGEAATMNVSLKGCGKLAQMTAA